MRRDNGRTFAIKGALGLSVIATLAACTTPSIPLSIGHRAAGPGGEGPAAQSHGPEIHGTASGPGHVGGRGRAASTPPDRADEPDGSEGSETAANTLEVAVVSDLNGRYGSTTYDETVHRAVDWLRDEVRPDLVVSTGDHVAGQKPGLDYAGMWEAFHRSVTGPLERAGIPFAPTPGNHDASPTRKYRSERRRYVREWQARRPDLPFVDREHFPLRYAFRRGPALFVSLDATMPGELPDAQFEWLREVLRANRSAPAKILYGHLPLVPFTHGRESEILGSARLIELLKSEGVDLVLSGHHHAYYPGYLPGHRGAAGGDGLRVAGMACLGGGPRRLLGREEPSSKSVALLTIHPDGRVDLRARTGEDFQTPVRRRDLPRALEHDGWRVVRDDLAGVGASRRD